MNTTERVRISLIVVSLVLTMALPVPARNDHADKNSVQGRFVGAWRLAWLEEPGTDGKVHRADCSGLLVYTRDGHMSVQVMYRNPDAEGSQNGQVQYAQGGYEASFGRFEINDAHTFTFHVEGAMVRSLIGKDLPRTYEFSGNQLIVKSTDPNERWRVAWEHYLPLSGN
jgi:Lipocalin-like domain